MKKTLFIALLIALGCGRAPEGTTEGDCQDEQDNDVDGRYDCDDDGCTASTYCVNQARLAKEEEAARKKELAEKAKAEKAALAEKKVDLGPFFTVDDLLIQTGNNGSDINWKDSETYCKGLTIAGKSNWRLPTAEEAVKIIESKKLSTENESYVMWTSTKAGKKRAKIVGISQAAVNELAIQYKGQCRARCVQDTKK
ncbi:MAG: DUF1566 domain-containing protein [Deltaproteobacteria bacterium]|nr:DUF1566 domain-containing protein [Deltaproteobacteria bacterium]